MARPQVLIIGCRDPQAAAGAVHEGRVSPDHRTAEWRMDGVEWKQEAAVLWKRHAE